MFIQTILHLTFSSAHAGDVCKKAKTTENAMTGAQIVTVKGGSRANAKYPMWPGWILTADDGVVRVSGRAVFYGGVGTTVAAGTKLNVRLADDTRLTLESELDATFAESVQANVTLGFADFAFVLDKAQVHQMAAAPIRAMSAVFLDGKETIFEFNEGGQKSFAGMMACMAKHAK